MFDKLSNFVKNKFFTTNTGNSFATLSSMGIYLESENLADQISLDQYKKSFLVFTCMNKIATVFSGVNFELYKVLNTKGETERILDHEILDLIYRPNNLQTKSEFMRILITNLTLAGETFIRLLKDERGNIIGMINVRPDLIDVQVKDGVVTYIAYLDGKRVEYTNLDMIHIKKADPSNPLRGVGVLTPIIGKVTAEKKAERLQNVLFGNLGRPEGILWVKSNVSDDAKLTKESFKNAFKESMDDGTRVLTLATDNDAGFKYQQLTFSQTEMQMIENMKMLRDDIAMAFGVPKSLLTSDDVNLANAETGYKQFVNFTINPELMLVEETLNERLIEFFWNEPMYLQHVELVTEDRKMLLDELTQGIDKWITINEARQKMGLDPIGEAGDNLYRTFGTTEIQSLSYNPDTVTTSVDFTKRPSLYKKVKKYETLKKELSEKVYNKMMGTGFDIYTDAVFKSKFMNAINRVVDKNIKLFGDAMESFIHEQGNRVIKAFKELSDDQIIDIEHTPKQIFNMQKETDQAKELAKKKFPEMMLRAGNVGLMPVKMFHTKASDYELDQESMDTLLTRAGFFSESISTTTYLKIKDVIKQGLADEVGRDVMARRLRKLFTDMSATRARMIAQTEGTVVSNLGLKESYRQSPAVSGEKWLSARDERVRPEHQMNDGSIVPKGSVFPNGELYPGQHSINCRCVVAPIVSI